MKLFPDQSTETRFIKKCFICNSTRVHYLFSICETRVVRCDDCGLIFLNPQPTDAELARMVEGASEQRISFKPRESETIRAAVAQSHLSRINRYHGSKIEAMIEITRENEEQLQGGKRYDLCIVSDALEYSRSPITLLEAIHSALDADGTIAIVTPLLDGSNTQKRGLGIPAQLTYFDEKSIQTAMLKTGFHEILVEPCQTREGGRGMITYGRKSVLRQTPILSIILPAFNEAKTLDALMTALLQKEVDGLTIEIIMVESNSTDGTRDIALRYQGHPRVMVILEDRPKGKGHAVRTGLKAATGDYVLIQDADLEYDLEDYDALLEPLTAGRESFVLGSRHGGRNVWKMRQFAGQRGLSLFLNFGHWIFTTLVNVLFQQQLRDPFTMFKVFRRDCLYGLEFECNRFDFDYELLIKLIRKGYCPIELPVNYRSRSFKEGKKVRMFLDPLTWLQALIRLRFVKIDLMEGSERARQASRLDKKNPAHTLIH